MLKRILAVFLLTIIFFCGCTPASLEEAGDIGVIGRLTIGFSQLGAESDWRRANTQSMKNAFNDTSGYRLLVEDGQQKQSNQTMSIRRFIQQDVDYIVLAPVTETGWEPVLEEAKEADIPVIVVDRMVDVEDDSLYTCWVGSDFEEEAGVILAWLERFISLRDIEDEDLHIVDIQGTKGASAQIGRSNGLVKACEKNGWELLGSADGDFTQAKGKEAMNQLLDEFDNINVVYCENDNEALGAIEAIEERGGTVGLDIDKGDIMILSFDGINEQALELMKQKKIAAIAECNPDHGFRVRSIIETLQAGKIPDKLSYVSEGIYSADTSISQVTVNGVAKSVTVFS